MKQGKRCSILKTNKVFYFSHVYIKPAHNEFVINYIFHNIRLFLLTEIYLRVAKSYKTKSQVVYSVLLILLMLRRTITFISQWPFLSQEKINTFRREPFKYLWKKIFGKDCYKCGSKYLVKNCIVKRESNDVKIFKEGFNVKWQPLSKIIVDNKQFKNIVTI